MSCLDDDFRAGVAGACVSVLSVGCSLREGEMRLQGLGKIGQGLGFACALMRARAGTAILPYWRHLLEVIFRVWKLSSVQRLMCCNATSELFGSQMSLGLLRLLLICGLFFLQIMIILL